MPLILNIDTATGNGAAGLSENDNLLAHMESIHQSEHAAFIQPAIRTIMNSSGRSLNEIDAVAVSIGPGSYTGIRVGLSAAKGLCYALGKPLITVNTLHIMAVASIANYLAENPQKETNPLFCPMIDARRMEVFTALFDINAAEVKPSHALIIDENIFEEELSARQVIFSGDGAFKIQNLLKQSNAIVSGTKHDIKHLALLALKKFNENQFADLAYCEPFYLKAFYTTLKKKEY